MGLTLLAAAGCAEGPAAAKLGPTGSRPPTSAAPERSAAPTAARVLAPLTGLPATATGVRRPAVAVTMPVVGSTGLDRADLVFEEYETTGRLRAVALFQSQAAQAGPVGEIRPADPSLLPILRPLYATVGGATGTTGLLAQAKVTEVTTARAPAAYTAGTAGPMVSTSAVQQTEPGALPPPQVLPFAVATDKFATTALRSASSVTLTVPGATPETWTYSAQTKRWSRSGLPGVSVSNLVLQNVNYKPVTLRNPIRSVQSARVLGRGTCSALSGGTYTTCTWYKPSATNLTGYVDRSGVPLRFAPGPTWIVLVPPGAAVVAR
jgi:hypothetical protein